MATYCACGCGEIVLTSGARWKPGHHRRGKNSFDLAERKVQPKELGTTGTSIFAGQYNDDIVEAWNNTTTRFDKLEKMARTDSAGKALLAVITFPIRSVNWWVEKASDSAEDVAIAESITWNLMHGMTVGFDTLLREALGCVYMGFSLFEKVFESTDAEEFTGDIKWRKFAFRGQRTIDKWHLDKTGGLEGVHQEFNEGNVKVNIDIPIEKLLLFTYDLEGSNYQGNPLFRAIWRDYYYKDSLQRIEAIGLERFHIGIPIITLPKTATKADKDKAFDIVKKVRGDESAGIVLPEGWEFDIIKVSGEGGSMDKVVARYARNMFLAGLAQFLALGDKAVGSWALSKDQSALFLFSLNALANLISEMFNRHAIPQLVKLNWPNVTKFPTLVHEDMEQIDITGFIKNLSEAVGAGFLTSPDTDVEAEVRKMMNLPELTEEQIAKKEKQIEQKDEMVETNQQRVIDGEEIEKEDKKEKPKKENSAKKTKKMAEPVVLITDEDIVQAVIDFTERAPEYAGILDAEI